MTKKKIFLLVNGLFPTIWNSKEKAYGYYEKVGMSREALYCEFSEKDIEENFCNCVFFTLLKIHK